MKRLKRLLCFCLALVFVLSAVPLATVANAASNEETIFYYLIDEMGLNNAAACGVLANIEVESGFNPNIWGDYGTSYGICQWHNSRCTALQTYCANNGYDYTTLIGQLHYLQYELTTSYYSSVYSKLLSVANTSAGAYSASEIWCRYFEVPANVDYQVSIRGSAAQNTYWPRYKDASRYTVMTINDGSYVISPCDNSSFRLNIAGRSADSGANVELYENQNTTAQKFVFQKQSNGYYTIRNVNSNLYLDVAGAATTAGTNIQQCAYNGTDAQMWQLRDAGNGLYNIVSKCNELYLDLKDNSLSNGANIQCWTNNSSNAQKWRLSPTDTLIDGVYIMGAYNNSNYHWDVSGQSTDNGGNFNIWETLSGDALNAQKFVIQHGSDGYYTIRALHSGKYMDIAGSGTSNGTNLIQWEDGTCENHKFLVVPNTDGSYSFVGKCNGLYVDMDGGGDPANGTNLQCWTGNGSNAQKWWAMPQRTVNDGVYQLGAFNDQTVVLDVADHSTANGANLQVLKNSHAEGQLFALEYRDNGCYTLRDTKSNRYMDVFNGDKLDDTNLAVYDGEATAINANKLFRFIPNSDGTYSIVCNVSNLYVDLHSALTNDGNNVHCWTNTVGGASQKWWLLPTTLNDLDGSYIIQPGSGSDYAMSIEGEDKTASSANVGLRSNDGSADQQFQIITEGGTGYYLVKNCYSGRNLNVDHAYTDDGTNLMQYSLSDTPSGDNERWSIIPHYDGTYSFVSKCNGLYIDLDSNQLADGTNIQLWGTNSGANPAKKWTLESHIHSFTAEVIEPTCEAEGKTVLTCSSCGFTKNTDVTPALGHNYQLTDSAAANCTHVAVDIYTCDRCGHTYSQEKEIAWTDWSETPAPEGTDERLVQSRTVYRYRDYETVTSNAASMDGYELVSSRWVNSGSGSVEYASFHEGYNTSHSTYSTYHKNKVSASETETTKTVINSDNVVGYIYWHWCYGCSLGTPNWRWIAPRSRSDLASGQGTTMTTFHAWTSSSAPEALGGEICTSGYENYEGNSFVSFESNVSVCSSQCGDTYLWFYTPIYRQTYTNQVKEFTYGRYGAWSGWSETAAEAADTRQVETKTEYRYASADSYGDHVYETVKRVEATCTEEGYTGDEICVYCGAVQSVGTVIPATGHTEEIDPAVEATCTEAGKTEGAHCSACGVVIRAQTDVPAKGHTVAVDKAVAATCTTEGRTAGSHCSVCNLVFVAQTVVPAKGHTEGAIADNGDGTHTVFCSVCGAPIRTEEHSYTDGSCACGAAEPVTGPVYDANLIFRYNSFTMGSALNVVYIVGAGTTNYADVRAVVTKHNADGTTTEKTYSISEGTMKDSGGFSTFTFDGVAAKELGDTFVAKLYATGKDGTEYYGAEKTLSLKDFLLPYTQEADSAKKDLAVALLNYGAAAQVYFGYNYNEADPTTLVNYELTADQKVIDIREASATASVTGEGAKNVYNTVLLESKIVLYAIFNLSDYSSRIGELTAVVTNAETGETVATLPVTAMGVNGSFRFDDVSAKNTRTVFSVAIYDGENKVSQDLQWSIECMVSGCRADTGASQAKLNLANAILAYGDYAAAYLG